MKKMKIIFSKPKNKVFPIGSYAIRWYFGTEYSHVCYSFMSEKYDREIKYEAVGAGIRFIGSNLWKKHAEIVKFYEIEVSDETYTEIMKMCIDFAGEEYGFSQNVGIIIADIFNLDYNPFPKNQNCSEIMARLLEKEGYKFNKDYNLITPIDIDKTLAAGK